MKVFVNDEVFDSMKTPITVSLRFREIKEIAEMPSKNHRVFHGLKLGDWDEDTKQQHTKKLRLKKAASKTPFLDKTDSDHPRTKRDNPQFPSNPTNDPSWHRIRSDNDDEWTKGRKSCSRLEHVVISLFPTFEEKIREAMAELGYDSLKDPVGTSFHVLYDPRDPYGKKVDGSYNTTHKFIQVKHPNYQYSFVKFTRAVVHEMTHWIDPYIYYGNHIQYKKRPCEVRARTVALKLEKEFSGLIWKQYWREFNFISLHYMTKETLQQLAKNENMTQSKPGDIILKYHQMES